MRQEVDLLEHTLHRMHERKPMPPTAPRVPVFLTQAAHPWANVSCHPLLDNPCTRMNMRKVKGSNAIGRRLIIVATVGKVHENNETQYETNDWRVIGPEEEAGVLVEQQGCWVWASVTVALSGNSSSGLQKAPRHLVDNELVFGGCAVGLSASSWHSSVRNSMSCCVWMLYYESNIDLNTTPLTDWCNGFLLCTQSWRKSLISMMTAGGTVTSHTGTPTTLVPTRTANVMTSRMLPKIAPCLSCKVATGSWAPSDTIVTAGGTSSGERNRKKRTGYMQIAVAINGTMTCAIYVMKERENAPASTRLVILAETRTTEAELLQ